MVDFSMGEDEDEDFNGFSIKEGMNSGRHCPNFIIIKNETDRMCES